MRYLFTMYRNVRKQSSDFKIICKFRKKNVHINLIENYKEKSGVALLQLSFACITAEKKIIISTT